jgi:hypothetical protein
MARRKTTTPQTAPSERARAATERARERLAESEGKTLAVDINRVPLSWWRERWDRTHQRLFIENFIYVRDAFDKNKRVLMKFNDFQDDYHKRRTGKDVRVKPRRLGSSLYDLAAAFTDALVLSNQHVRTVPHDPDTQEEFFDALQVMYDNLPEHLQVATTSFTVKLIKFQDKAKGTTGSKIKSSTVQPGHEAKGRGQAITHLLLTEVPHWRGNAKKAVTALIEAAQGGQITLESTPLGVELFHATYQEGKQGKGGWTSHAYEWWWKREYRITGCYFIERNRDYYLFNPGEPYAALFKTPVTKEERHVSARIFAHLLKRGYLKRGANWRAAEVAEYLAWRRTKIEQIGEPTFKVEYLENDKDCFTQTGRPLVRADLLTVSCKPSRAIEGHEYLIAADTSLGLQTGDPAAIEVLDIHTGRQVHERSLTLAPDLLAMPLAELSDEYNGAMIVVERNGPGIATILKLIELGYEDRLYKQLTAQQHRAVEDGDVTLDEAMHNAQHGFQTTVRVKPLLGVKLEAGIRTGELGLSSEEFCTEAKTVVWFDDRSWGALPGHHDDRVMALAIGWYVSRTQMGLTGFVGVMPETGYAR